MLKFCLIFFPSIRFVDPQRFHGRNNMLSQVLTIFNHSPLFTPFLQGDFDKAAPSTIRRCVQEIRIIKQLYFSYYVASCMIITLFLHSSDDRTEIS